MNLSQLVEQQRKYLNRGKNHTPIVSEITIKVLHYMITLPDSKFQTPEMLKKLDCSGVGLTKTLERMNKFGFINNKQVTQSGIMLYNATKHIIE